MNGALSKIGYRVPHFGKILRRHYRLHAGIGFRSTGIDRFDSRMGVRAAQHSAVQQSSRLKIRPVEGATGYFVNPSCRMGRVPTTLYSFFSAIVHLPPWTSFGPHQDLLGWICCSEYSVKNSLYTNNGLCVEGRFSLIEKGIGVKWKIPR